MDFQAEAIKAVIVAAITCAVGYVGYRIAEARRRICFSVKSHYFGGAKLANAFMGGNYPSDNVIEFSCEIRFFSNKSTKSGLHSCKLEFCRTTYMGLIDEHTVDGAKVYLNWMEPNGLSNLDTVELPPREFITLKLTSTFDRDEWPILRQCDFVRFVGITPEGKKKAFPITPIRFPDMPAEPPPSTGVCSVQLWATPATKGSCYIAAIKINRRMGPPGQLMPHPGDMRFWNGSTWVVSMTDSVAAL